MNIIARVLILIVQSIVAHLFVFILYVILLIAYLKLDVTIATALMKLVQISIV